MTTEHLPCNEVVELLTDYLEGSLDAATTRRVEEHLALCPPCVVYLQQLRTTITQVGLLPTDVLSEAAMAELEAAFRDVRPPSPRESAHDA